MLPLHVYASRRSELSRRHRQPVLLMGCGERSRNLPMNKLPFRQDSTFLYFTGCALPDAAALLVDGRFTLFVPKAPDDDALWHGRVSTMDEIQERYGADAVLDAGDLAQHVQAVQPATLAIADENRNAWARHLLSCPLRFGQHHGDTSLMDAVIEMRRVKSEREIAEMRRAAEASGRAHRAVIQSTHPGGHERSLAALFRTVLAMDGCELGYDTILTQSGEVLHNHAHDATLEAGRLLLCDGGGEVSTGYGADITRTWPVSGRFTNRQRAVYDAVLAAQLASIEKCVVGQRFLDVHMASCRVLTQFLVDEGIAVGGQDELLAKGAHALFFPHGIGHHLGMDVHDLENFGDRSSYPPDRGRPEPFGLCYLRLDLPLVADWVVTVEPGFYVAPAILQHPELRESLGDCIRWDRLSDWEGFGGIRIEDDIRITPDGPENLSHATPKLPDAIEEMVGTRPSPEDLLCGL